ncbi:CGNL1 protein, partial [Atractosteus spatula]|nr:CGNL1 protein [Atractosteus spatula]
MESYRVGGIPSSPIQQDYMQCDRTGRSQSNGTGSYGVSIRVQGIDGHPYVVLNNRERESLPCRPQNGYSAPCKDEGESFIDHYHEYDFKGSKLSRSENPFVEYRSQKQMLFSGSHNGVTEFKEMSRKTSTLLNFQRHPELLKPYDPENNSWNLEGCHSLPPRPASFAETGSRFGSSLPLRASSPIRSSSFENPQPENNAVVKPSPPACQEKVGPQSSSAVSCSADTPKLTAGTPGTTTSSTDSSLERKSPGPDILPLRRYDSSGPVLESSRSRRSSGSSTTAASVTSANKLLQDDQDDALYAENINRHENRRYIPFVPGTGRDIDTGSIPGVEELIDKFDKKHSPQRRGRAGRRNRINPEDFKRSRSVDSALPFGLRGDAGYSDLFRENQGKSTERLLRPSRLRQQKAAPGSSLAAKASQSGQPSSSDVGKVDDEGPVQDSSLRPSPGCNSGKATNLGSKPVLCRSSTLPFESKGYEEEKMPRSIKVLSTTVASPLAKTTWSASKKSDGERDTQATPDLLKGQQELSQQTNEETAKQILFNYLKDGSTDNDDTTKKKVNLVFEKIQTLKSRAAGNVQTDNKTPDSSAEAKLLLEQRNGLERKVTELRKQLEEETKTHRRLTETREKAEADVTELQKNLERSQEECSKLREQLSKTEKELQVTVEELFQVKMEREQYQTEIRDLQDQLSEMHDELDSAKTTGADEQEKEAILEDMLQLKLDFQEMMIVKEDQEEVLRRKERELTALKGALKEEVSSHDQEVDKLREQYEEELRRLCASVEEAKEGRASVSKEKSEVEAAKRAAEDKAARLGQELEKLRRRVQELENEVAKLNRIIDQAKLEESRRADRMGRLEKEKRQLEESLVEVREQEEAMTGANRALTNRLEEVQRNLTKLTHEHKELNERLKDEKSQKEQFKKTKNEIEDERRLLDRTVEKLQKEMCEIVEASQTSTQELQVQIDEYKEKNRKELTDLQRQLRDRSTELEKSRLASKKLQDELTLREEDLRQCKKEQDEAVLRGQKLEQKIYDLEIELDAKSHIKDDRSRQVKLLEDRIAQLELDLEEERNSGDLLMDRIDRGREQLEQMRNELLQERAARQDLECDKISLERQNKDLKSRVAYLEGSQKPNKDGLVSQLESRIQELEERLEVEERDRANLQMVNRRLERKVKEMMMQVEDEHHTLMDQKDQLTLRLKALKRQMDEAEEEIDRLEHSKKKLQRDLDEQVEANEQLQGQLSSLRNEMRRKSTPAALLNDLDEDDDDDLSIDGDNFYSSSTGYKLSNQDHSP